MLAGVFKQESIPEAERLHPEEVVARWWRSGATPCWRRTWRRLSMHVATGAQPGDVVAILSNGGFDGIYEKLPARLAGQPAVSSLK